MIFQRDYLGSHAFFLPKNEHSLNYYVFGKKEINKEVIFK